MNYDDVYADMFAVGRKHHFRPDVPIEGEDFFRKLVSSYTGPTESFVTWLEEQAVKYYRFMVKPPDWLQGPEWPIFQGKPMLFVGQADLPRGSNSFLKHDASFYVFWDYDTGSTRVVIQAA